MKSATKVVLQVPYFLSGQSGRPHTYSEFDLGPSTAGVSLSQLLPGALWLTHTSPMPGPPGLSLALTPTCHLTACVSSCLHLTYEVHLATLVCVVRTPIHNIR